MVQKKKLLVVDDSAFMRKLITDFFKNDTTIEVVGTARNGKDAISKIKALKPDVVTMDVEMPEMNGVEALKHIMHECPVPVVMLSSKTKAGADITLETMANGAVDFIAKPSGTISLDLHKIEHELVQMVKAAANVPVTKLRTTVKTPSVEEKVRERTIQMPKAPTYVPKTIASMRQKMQAKALSAASKKIVVIGTSTGGPRALQEVLTNIPKKIKAPILVVQHMPAGFTQSLAKRLDQLSEIKVKEAEEGDIIQNGTAYIAPGGYHMKLRKVGMSYSIELDKETPPVAGHRPSVDVMFENVAQQTDLDKVAVIMTGMGSDGTKGLQRLKQSGNVISITESQQTCVVYGMPKAAFEAGLADEVVNVDEIALSIMNYIL